MHKLISRHLIDDLVKHAQFVGWGGESRKLEVQKNQEKRSFS